MLDDLNPQWGESIMLNQIAFFLSGPASIYTYFNIFLIRNKPKVWPATIHGTDCEHYNASACREPNGSRVRSPFRCWLSRRFRSEYIDRMADGSPGGVVARRGCE